MSRLSRWGGIILLLAYFAQGAAHIRHASITFDEGPHLTVGYVTLRTGDFRLQPVHIHPPLANVIAAAPLLLQRDLPDPRTVDGWEIASLSALTDAVVWRYPHPARLATAGRFPILFLGVLLGAVIFRWAFERWGAWGGMAALGFAAFDPNLVAHGSLITTDMAATFLGTLTLYTVDRGWRRGSVGWGWVGVWMGLAQLAKVSALLLIPVVGVLLLIREGHHPRRLVRSGLALTLSAALVVWAGYGFQVAALPGLPFPMPAATHFAIYRALHAHYTQGHPAFLAGRVGRQGWPLYFPIAFVLKTPLPTLLLLTTSALPRRRANRRPRSALIRALPLILYPLLYALSALWSTVNIGYRHLLPLLPFAYLVVGRAIACLPSDLPGTWRGVLCVLFLLLGTSQAVAAIRIAPHELAYFNAIAGGAEGGYRYLVDSNLDWGQNLWDLQAWMKAHGAMHVYYAHYSPARPQVYGIPADFLPPDPRAVSFTPWEPSPGLYAIGVTLLQGPYLVDVNTYAWFRAREPLTRLGYALWLYEVPPRPPADWAVVCAGVPISSEQVREATGRPSLRVLTFACEQAALYADGVGLYLTGMPSPPPGATADLTLRTLDGTTAQWLYRVTAAPTPSHLRRAETEGPLTFLGYTVESRDEALTLRTWWRVTAIPARPLSLMAHLVGADGTLLAVGDGLGVPIEQWAEGDIIVQRHLLPMPPDVTASPRLAIGAYWLDTMERFFELPDVVRVGK